MIRETLATGQSRVIGIFYTMNIVKGGNLDTFKEAYFMIFPCLNKKFDGF